MAATAAHLTSVEEFRRLPEDSGSVYHELRQGVVVAVTRPKGKHIRIQKNIERLVDRAAGDAGVAVMELPFRPLADYEVRVADVAYVTAARWESIDPDDQLRGAPDIVIEVLSSSNTASEILDKERLCLGNGAKEFWAVDPDRCRVRVTTPNGHTVTYEPGQEIPLSLLGRQTVAVDALFA